MPFYSKVVGVSHKNTDGTRRQKLVSQCEAGEMLKLVREPDNPHDPNAIAVYSASGQLGYLSAEVAEELAEQMDAGAELGAEVQEVTGGVDGLKFGVNIKLVKFESAGGTRRAATGLGWKVFVAASAVAVVAAIAYVAKHG